MNLYAFAVTASRNELAWDRTEVMSIVIAADSSETAAEKAEEQARRKYPKSHGWNIKTSMVEVSQEELLNTIENPSTGKETRVVGGEIDGNEEPST
ncbi:MAG TPA: hypothetical protein VFC63_07080 [Blastocatellia bacterium]|nr:hypothetical protein [Blastocatellia bacterium]